MAAPVRIASTKTFQREKYLWVPAIASITAPTALEINSASGIDMSCYLMANSAKPTQATNTVQLARRICDGAQYSQIGTTTYNGGDALYAVDPQAASGTAGKKALTTLPAGTTGFLVRRLGKAVLTDVAATDRVDVFPTEWGQGFIMPSADDEAAEAVVMQTYAITGPPALDVAVV